MTESAEALFERLLQEKAGRRLPPVEDWNPEREGEIDIRIDAEGEWHHEGDRIARQAIVDLFASILRKEGNSYYLVTPAEKLRIQVDDVPFQVIDFERSGEGRAQRLLFLTRTGDRVVADADHPLRVESAQSEPAPYLLIRNDMWGRLSRNAFYRLVELAEPAADQPDRLGVFSDGHWFELGRNAD